MHPLLFVSHQRSQDPDAEVIPVLIPEKDLLDPESMPTFDGDDDDAEGKSREKNKRTQG